MQLEVNELMNNYLGKTKKCTSLELASDAYPYVEVNGILKVREEYVALCLNEAEAIWRRCEFSKELIVVYEDKFSSHHKGERDFIESCLEVEDYAITTFHWQDEDEIYKGTRYSWKTKQLDYRRLFEKIILSDIGEGTELDCSVYIIDQQSENVFFLYDDRGIDLYIDNEGID